jgi:hypothetical protein
MDKNIIGDISETFMPIIIIIVILIYYFAIIIIYESINNPIYSLNWPIVLRFITGINKPDSSLQDFMNSYSTYNSSMCDKKMKNLSQSDLANLCGGYCDARDASRINGGGSGSSSTNIDSSSSTIIDKPDYSPIHKPSSEILQQWKNDHQTCDGFENKDTQDNTQDNTEKSTIGKIMDTGNNIYNKVKLQIDNIYMKSKINGKTYLTKAKYKL